MKRALATATLALFATTAIAETETTLYGQVNKSLLVYDDGKNTDVAVGDNNLSSTRLGLKTSTPLDNGLKAISNFEFEMTDNSTGTLTQNSDANVAGGQSATPVNSNAATATARQAHVGLTGDYGTFMVGRMSTAIDSVVTQDLGGAQDVMISNYRLLGGALGFRNSTTGALTGFTTQGQTSNIPTKRTNAVRYDSPIFAGFQGRASVAQQGDTELAGYYTGEFGDFKLKGAAGVELNNDLATAANSPEQRYGASFSVAHKPTGLAFTSAYTLHALDNTTAGADDGTQSYFKVSYTPVPAYEFAVDYGMSAHMGSPTAAKDDFATYGVAAQYNMGNGVSAGVLYRNFDLERSGTPTDAIDMAVMNLRVKF